MTIISNSTELAAFCDRMAKEEFVCVDTEFMRERTYYSKLCLIQIAGTDEAVAIDPLAEGISLEPVHDLMADPNVMKVFHACRQDMEIFYYQTKTLPAPLFDTQIGAMVCGHGESVSYDKLVRKLTGAQVDKTSRFTDWSNRPLTDAQIGYAISDVTHLRTVYEKLAAQLKENGRESWLEEEFEVVTSPSTYELDPRDAWLRLKVRSGKTRFLAVVRELAAYRELEARRRDIPRNRIIRDDVLLDIAARSPREAKDLAKVRNISEQFAGGRSGAEIMEAVGRALAIPEGDCPRIAQSNDSRQPRPAIVELLRVLLKQKSEQHQVAQKLIANAADLEAIAIDDDADVPAMRGWRKTIFGDDALALKAGRLALSASDGEVRLIAL
ncbi:MAG: ribonuclease D [Alphaproteobacteria bacterium]|nr:ribonuclease D [Alphaproteobacteria bacterium]